MNAAEPSSTMVEISDDVQIVSIVIVVPSGMHMI